MNPGTKSKKKSLDVELVPLEECHIAQVLEIENLCFSEPWRECDFTRLLDNPDIAVHPDYQSRSVGSRLLKKTIQLCRRRRTTAIFLEVRTSNRKAIELYELFGFIRIGLRRGYYSNPVEDALIMKLDLL
jgi:ribosomal-protein-alanine N-acetyltransferase